MNLGGQNRCNEFRCNENRREQKKRDSNHKLLPLLKVRYMNQNGKSGSISVGSSSFDEEPNSSARYLSVSLSCLYLAL